MEVKSLKMEINAIKMHQQANTERSIPSTYESSLLSEIPYHTDEEELHNETFVEVVNHRNKKRKYKPSTPPSQNVEAVRKGEKKLICRHL